MLLVFIRYHGINVIGISCIIIFYASQILCKLAHQHHNTYHYFAIEKVTMTKFKGISRI